MAPVKNKIRKYSEQAMTDTLRAVRGSVHASIIIDSSQEVLDVDGTDTVVADFSDFDFFLCPDSPAPSNEDADVIPQTSSGGQSSSVQSQRESPSIEQASPHSTVFNFFPDRTACQRIKRGS